MSALTEADSLVSEVLELRGQVSRLEALLEEHRSPRVQVLHEPLTYEARLVRDKSGHGGFRAVATRENHCYLRDLATYRLDMTARTRLDRHDQEMRALGEARQRIFHPDADYEFETRAVNWTNGTGGYFAPPLWIIEHFAEVPTPHRVLSAMAPQFELPEGAQSVNLPALSVGADVGVQAVGGAAPGSTSVTDTAISSAVATIAGNFDVPMQMLEQSPQGAHLDWVAFTNMEARAGYQLENQLFAGTGAATPQGSGNNQLLGIFNNTAVPTANQITYTSGSPTATAMFTFLGQSIAQVGNSRRLPPEAWLMTTSRSAWIGSSEDIQSRPLMLTDNTKVPGQYDLIAYPVYPDEAIPVNLGAGGNEDRVIICRPSDWLILESERRTQVMLEPLSGTLQARLQMRRYVAALLRYPTSVGWLQGTGMARQSGF